ncbi:MAG: CPBP family intramembrane metalloprotease [Deltaproteobacteria bacterium]|nr:CPBP family intramembrane metalloprotease [Deltaproteobacteria bacterium]
MFESIVATLTAAGLVLASQTALALPNHDVGREPPFARGRHLVAALAAGIAYVVTDLDFAKSALLEWFGGTWTTEAVTFVVAAQLLLVMVPVWLALAVCDTHSGVTLWPKSWKPLRDGYTLWLLAGIFVWMLSRGLSMPESERAALAEDYYRIMFSSEGLDWAWYLTYMTTGALAEELLFRVLLQRGLEGYMPKHAAVLVQAILWVLMHAFLYGYGLSLHHVIGGVVLGLVFMRTRSLMAPLLCHLLINITLAAVLVRGIGA